jgi:DNA-binding NarL/FixJ family response regulator
MCDLRALTSDTTWTHGLERAGHTVSHHATAAGLMASLKARPADAVAVELGRLSLDELRALRRAHPRLPVLARCAAEGQGLMDALKAGLSGALLPLATAAEWQQAVAEAKAGGSPLAPLLARLLVDQLTGASTRQAESMTAPLTPRERDVLQLLTKGITYSGVGDLLGIGIGTVQSHVKRIYEKLDVSSKAEATAIALSYGLVNP